MKLLYRITFSKGVFSVYPPLLIIISPSFINWLYLVIELLRFET